MEIALRLDLEIDQAVAGELLQHMVEEADAGGYLRAPLAVQIDGGAHCVSLVFRVISARRMASIPKMRQGCSSIPLPAPEAALPAARLETALARMPANAYVGAHVRSLFPLPPWLGSLARHHHPLGPQGQGQVVIAGDGQVSFGNTVIKSNARKVRRAGQGRRHRRLRRGDGRCLRPVRAAGGQAGAASGPARPRLRRAGQGLAHRPLSAPARGDDGGGRQAGQPGPDRAPATCWSPRTG